MKNLVILSTTLFLLLGFYSCTCTDCTDPMCDNYPCYPTSGSSYTPAPTCSITCQNGGTVTGDCECNCPSGYTGTYCQTEVPQYDYVTFTPTHLVRWCPTWIGGDREFDGNGPAVEIRITLTIQSSRYLRANVWYHLKETTHDWSEALLDESVTIYEAPPGKTIQSILSASSVSYSYIDNSNSVPRINGTSAHLVDHMDSMGDTSGDDIGNCTGDDSYLTVVWNPIDLKLRVN